MAKAKVKVESGESSKAKREPWKLQGYTSVTLKRSSIRFHEQNPRFIDKHAFRKLRDSLKRNHLIEPVIVNRRLAANGFSDTQDGTLVIVGGHQRTKAADDIMGYPEKVDDYDVPGALIEVSPGREKEILIALNNPGLQGQWDAAILEDLLGSGDLDVINTGFERADLAHVLDDGMLDGLFGETGKAQAEIEGPIVDQLNEIHATARQFERDVKAAEAIDNNAAENGSDDVPSPAGQSRDKREQADPELMRQGMIERRRTYVQSQQENRSTEFFLVFIAETEEQLSKFLSKSGLPNEKYVSLSVLAETMGIDINEARNTTERAEREPKQEQPAQSEIDPFE